MNTQVIFKIEKSLKDKAMKRAKSDGIALSAVLKSATKAYAEGSLTIGLTTEPRLNANTRRILARELKEIRAGKNISDGFHSAKDTITFLNTL